MKRCQNNFYNPPETQDAVAKNVATIETPWEEYDNCLHIFK